MLRIKRFRDQMATTGFTVVAGKAALVIRPNDVIDAPTEEDALMLTGMFEPCDQAFADQADLVFDQSDVDAARAVESMYSEVKPFNPRSPKNVAIQKAIEKYGGVDKVPDDIRKALLGAAPPTDSEVEVVEEKPARRAKRS